MIELLNPQTFEVTLPSHLGMGEGDRPVFTFKTRSWRKSIELDEITARFMETETDGEAVALLAPVIMEHLVTEKSPDIERLNCEELVELFVGLRECESIELIAKKKSLLQSLFGAEKSVESDAEIVPDPNPSSLSAPAAAEQDAPVARSEGSLT